MSDTKSFTFFLAKDGYWLCPLRCRIFFNVTNAVISNSKGYFQRTTALSKSQATAAAKGAEKSVKVFFARRGAAKLAHSRVVFLWEKLPASERRTRDIFVCENSRAEERVTDFVCAVPFCYFLCDKKLRENDLNMNKRE